MPDGESRRSENSPSTGDKISGRPSFQGRTCCVSVREISLSAALKSVRANCTVIRPDRGFFCHPYIGQVPWPSAFRRASSRATTRSSRAIATTATCWRDPKEVMVELTHASADRPRARAGRGALQFDADRLLCGGHVSSAPRWRWARAWRLRASIVAMTWSAFVYFGDGASNQGQVLRELQHGPAVGSCRPSTSSRTTSAMRASSIERRPRPNCISVAPASAFRANIGRRHGQKGCA